MLDRIPYSSYSLTGLTALAERLTQVLRTYHSDDVMIKGCIAKIEQSLEQAITTMGNDNESIVSGSLSEADDLRDVCYRSLRDHIQAGMGRDTNKMYQEACNRLWKVFKINNTLLASLPYDEETAALKKLFIDLKSFTKEIGIIGATQWIHELIKANEDFESIMEAHMAKDDKSKTFQSVKASLTDMLKILVSTVNSLWAFNRPVGIQDTVLELNQIIEEENEAILQH